MCAGPLGLVLAGTLITGFTTKIHGRLVFGTSYFSGIAAFLLPVPVVWGVWAWRHRHRLDGRDRCLSDGSATRGLWMTLWFCVLGIVIGVTVRLGLGRVDVTAFCNGSAPLIAGLLIGIVFDGSPAAQRRALTLRHSAAYRQRQLGVIYILSGAVCTALGKIRDSSSFGGDCEGSGRSGR